MPPVDDGFNTPTPVLTEDDSVDTPITPELPTPDSDEDDSDDADSDNNEDS